MQCNLVGYVVDLSEDDVLTLKHVGVMVLRNRLINCQNSVHLLVYYTYRILLEVVF
jgi:hypothetical protein